MKNTRLLLLPVLYLLVLPVLAQHGLSSERLSRYDAFLEQEIEAGNMAGAVSLIVRNGQVAHNKAYGKRNVSQSEKMQENDLFFIQSMTKPIITVAFMMLYEEGHFFLTDPVEKYLPEFGNLSVSTDPAAGLEAETVPLNSPITIAQLLSHTAGLSHGLGNNRLEREYLKAMYLQDHKTIQDRMNRMLELPLIGQPGEQWYYSAATDVLSVLIEHFSGQSTEDFLQERILDPLGMTETGYNLSDNQLGRVATVHEMKNGELVAAKRQPSAQGNTLWSGVNGLFSTASDYMKFCQMMLNNGSWNGKRYLSRKTVQIMTMNQIDELYGEQGWGFGFAVITNLAAKKSSGSEGQYFWSGAFRTHFFIDPKENLIAILMTQTNPYSSYYDDKMRQFVYQAIDD